MKELDEYNAAERRVLDYFGYQAGYEVLPISDCRERFWSVNRSRTKVRSARTVESMNDPEGSYCENPVYGSVHVPTTMFVGPEFTMIAEDTQTDDNIFLSIYDNEKRVPWNEEWDEW